jgi:hypothetical protein
MKIKAILLSIFTQHLKEKYDGFYGEAHQNLNSVLSRQTTIRSL